MMFSLPFITRCGIPIPGILTLFVLCLGCGGQDGLPRYPVRGTVLFNDRPVAEAIVVFHPTSGNEKIPRPMDQTDAEGKFELTEGAPAGEYAITVELRAERQVGEEMIRDGADLLPPRYKKPNEAGLIYTVTVGNNEVPPLKLTDR